MSEIINKPIPKMFLEGEDGFPTRKEVGASIGIFAQQIMEPIARQSNVAANMIDSLYNFLRDVGLPVFSVDGQTLLGRAKLNEVEVVEYMKQKLAEDRAVAEAQQQPSRLIV